MNLPVSLPGHVHTISLAMSVCYLIEGSNGIVLVDAGLRGEEKKILKKMTSLGHTKLQLIYITHAHIDHSGAAAALRRVTGAPIAVHEADAADLRRGETTLGSARGWGHVFGAMLPCLEWVRRPEPTEPDLTVRGGDRLDEFGLDATVIHTPGHTIGSSTLHVDGRLAFAGDLISTTGRPHMQRAFAQDWRVLHESIKRLQDLNPDWVYPGHGMHPARSDELSSLPVPKPGDSSSSMVT